MDDDSEVRSDGGNRGGLGGGSVASFRGGLGGGSGATRTGFGCSSTGGAKSAVAESKAFESSWTLTPFVTSATSCIRGFTNDTRSLRGHSSAEFIEIRAIHRQLAKIGDTYSNLELAIPKAANCHAGGCVVLASHHLQPLVPRAETCFTLALRNDVTFDTEVSQNKVAINESEGA